MMVTLKRCRPVGRNYVTRVLGLTPLPMSMSSPTARATPRDALRGVALSFVSMRPATASVGANGLHLSVLMPFGTPPQIRPAKHTAPALPTTKPLGVIFSMASSAYGRLPYAGQSWQNLVWRH
jgi:hypothetical protein